MPHDLFGPAPQKKPTSKKAAPKAESNGHTPSPLPELMTYYHDRFIARFGCKPLGMPRLGRELKEMVDAWGVDAVREVIDRFFASRDARITGSDYSVGVFKFHAQRLRIGVKALDPRTAANAAEVAKATGRE